MARGAVRGAATAWLGLVVLQVAVTKGAGPLAGAFDVANGFVQRALDPTVPAIPDVAGRTRAAGQSTAAPPASTGPAPATTAPAPKTLGTMPDPRKIPVPPNR